MPRRILSTSLVLGTFLGLGEARATDDPRFVAEFVQGLRERGYYDVALQYLDALRQDPLVAADLKRTIDYEEGRTLIQEATHSNDPDVKTIKFQQAKVKIEAFVKANPDLPQTTEALVELAHLLYERGNAEVDLAQDARAASERDTRLVGARGYYESARNAYDRAFERLNAKLVGFPKFLPADDPRKLEREGLRNTVMQAELQKNIVDYYEAQTYPLGSKERGVILDKALLAFEKIFNNYRGQRAGLTARMWQGKCFEEAGQLGAATGIYKELLDHADPQLLSLQRQVDYFRIIVTGKRKEYALAVDESIGWLRRFPRDRRSYEALGVQFELAKDLIAQLPALAGDEHAKAVRVATDSLIEVVRFVSPFKSEAIELLQKYRPNAALNAADISKMTYDEAVAQAGQARQTLAYENAIALLKHAIRKVGPAQNAAKANSARYMLAYCEFMSKRYYEAAVVAEFVARRYPRDEWAGKSANLAMQAIVEAYNTFSQGNRASDLDRLVDLARYTAGAWPETEEGDSGRVTLGLVSLGRGRYAEAIAAFDSVRPSYSKYVDAQTSCGDAHWKQSLVLREKGGAKEADAEVEKALAKLTKSLRDRRDANAPDDDLGLVNNACDLAVIELETNKAGEALALLDPIARKLANLARRDVPQDAAYSRVVSNVLRAHVATDKVDLAIADMRTLEAIGGGNNVDGQLYRRLGRLLEREMEALRQKNEVARLKKMENSYQQFLKALVASKSGQTFASLLWAADNLLKLGSAKEANQVYATLLNSYAKDPSFLKTPNAAAQVTLIRLRQVAALRSLGSLPEAEAQLNELLEQNKRSIEPQMEKGYLLDAKAEARQGKWLDAYNHWKAVALKLGNMNPKPTQYYEAWFQAASALQREGKRDLARTTIASVMRLSPPGLGGPEMKAKYELLLKQVTK